MYSQKSNHNFEIESCYMAVLSKISAIVASVGDVAQLDAGGGSHFTLIGVTTRLRQPSAADGAELGNGLG